MSFATGHLNDPATVVAGEEKSVWGLNIPFQSFEDGLKFGRFAKYDSAQLDNMDSSATPQIAGVVLRSQSRSAEDTDSVDSSLGYTVTTRLLGMVTIEVVSGDTPAKFGAVFASNAGDSNDGKATTTDVATTESTNGIFWEDQGNDVWSVILKG